MRLRALIAAAAALGLAAVGTPAQATVLLPNTNTPIAVDGTSHTAASLNADFGAVVVTQTFPLSTLTFTGSVLEEVRIRGGVVTFDFKVTNSGPSTDDITRLATQPFKGVTTDVFTTSGDNTYTADRKTANGNALAFNFDAVMPGSSAYLIVRTSASAYSTNGTVAISDGTNQTVVGFAPVVPEPGTAVLSALSLGVVGLGAVGFRRRSAGK